VERLFLDMWFRVRCTSRTEWLSNHGKHVVL